MVTDVYVNIEERISMSLLIRLRQIQPKQYHSLLAYIFIDVQMTLLTSQILTNTTSDISKWFRLHLHFLIDHFK